MPPFDAFENPFSGFLEQEPLGRRAAFFGQPGFSGFTPFQRQFAGTTLFPQFENQFLGQLGQQILGGQTPTLRFTDFLRENLNPQRELRQAPQFQTGLGTSRLVSPTRHLYQF